MSQKILTIAIAAYQVEAYIENTLSSLIVPEAMDAFEVLVIDDGGTDKTLEIAAGFAEQYPGTFRLIHKRNGGYGTVVNHAIGIAEGKYFKLLDGDDWFDNEGFARYLSALREADEDALVTPMYNVTDEKTLINHAGYEEDMSFDIRNFHPRRPLSHWCLTFKTSVLRESGVRCLAHTLYTDQIYSTVPFSMVETVRFLNIPLYAYRLGRDGQSMSRESRIRHINDLLRVNHLLYEFCSTEKNNPAYTYLLFRVSTYYMSAFKLFLILPSSRKNLAALKQYEKKSEAAYPEIYREAEVSSRTGSLLKAMRKSDYRLYWLFRFADHFLTNF